MLRVAGAAVLVATLTLTMTCSLVAADQGVALFNGKNLDGWAYHLVDPNVRMADVWRVENGVLICKGSPLGYLVTKESFKSFKLIVEWRWAPGKEPGNSGVLLRISSDPIGFMPRCAEAQLKHGSAGDVWGFRGFPVTGAAERLRKIENHKELGTFVGVGKLKDAEKQPGQWNQYVIMMVGDKLTLEVNGEPINAATGCDVVAGPIGLQSEGGEIQFRTVKLTPIAE
jgi:hypothetical protein